MSERYTMEQFLADKEAREKEQERREQERSERTEKGEARRAWKDEGSSEEDFEREWPRYGTRAGAGASSSAPRPPGRRSATAAYQASSKLPLS